MPSICMFKFIMCKWILIFCVLKMNNLNLGFIGVGLMGLSLVKRLSNLGYKIDAYDKNLKKLEP